MFSRVSLYQSLQYQHSKFLRQSGVSLLAVMISCTGASLANAQGSDLNPDNLSFFEEPLAFEFFGATVQYNHLFDLPVVYDFNSDDTDLFPRTNFRVNIERQLPNALTIGATYFGSYDDKEDDEYDDRWEVYGSGVWGRLSGGEVNDTVREKTRRWRGTGNADLQFDNVLGTLAEKDLGLAYGLRISAFTLNVGVDEHGNSDFGFTYERPNQYTDIRFTGRYTNSEIKSIDGTTVFDTDAVGIVAQLEYGSLALDVGLGYEHFDSAAADGERYFVSLGAHYKVRRITLSAEAHWGETDGNDETSYALGARYDLARGLSVNLGYNYAKSDAAINGIALQDVDKSEFLASLRYEY